MTSKCAGRPEGRPFRLLFLTVGARADLDLRSLAVLVVLETDELHQVALACFPVGTEQPADEVQLHGAGQRARIFERELVFNASPARARPPLNRMELLGVRCAAAV